MKKLIAVPVIAVIAAVGAASAAGLAVSAAPIQSGATNDLQCAASARVVEWGHDDSSVSTALSGPYVVNALVELTDSECQGQAVYLIALNPDGTERARFESTRLLSTLGSGLQYVRMAYVSPTGLPGIPTEDLNAIRISIDGGWSDMHEGGKNVRY